MTASSDASDGPAAPEAPAAPEGLDDDVDRVLRHLTQCFPEVVARALVPEARSIGAVRWMETQVSARQRRLDRSVWVEVDGSPCVEHVAWQLRGMKPRAKDKVRLEAETRLEVLQTWLARAVTVQRVADVFAP